MSRLNSLYLIWLLISAITVKMNQTYANTISTYTLQNKIYLTADEELDLIEAIHSFIEFAAKLHEDVAQIISMKVIKRLEGNFETEITPYLTERLRTILIKHTSSYDGPNCWNTVLYLLKIIDHLRYASDDEINYYLTQSGLFSDVTFDPIEVGDIGAVYDRKKKIMHTFIYLTDKLVIDKDGYLKSDYKIKHLDEIVQKYKKHEIRYYHCLPHEDIKELLAPIKYELLNVNKIVEKISRMLLNFVPSRIKSRQKILLFKQVFNYDRDISNLLKNNHDDLFRNVVFYTWEGAISLLSEFLKNTHINIKTLKGLLYYGTFEGIYLDKENKHSLSLEGISGKNYMIKTDLLDLQTITN